MIDKEVHAKILGILDEHEVSGGDVIELANLLYMMIIDNRNDDVFDNIDHPFLKFPGLTKTLIVDITDVEQPESKLKH